MNQARNWMYGVAPAFVGVLLFSSTAYADVFGDLEAPFREALQSGSFGVALGLVFLAGVATSLTPCVYPMIVITVSVFGARQAKSRAQGAMLSTFFVLGIAALFTSLGVIAAVTGGAFGSALTNPWVLGGLAVLFVILAMSMFGAFELNLPPALQNRLAQVGGVGFRGAFLLGLVSAVIAAPCTGPVLVVLLTWVATTGQVAFGALCLFAFALGLGLLFWLVGTFAITLPKSGRWLEWVKSVFGVLMLVMAFYYARNLLPIEMPAERSTLWIGVAVAMIVAGVLLGAVHLSFHGASLIGRLRKGVGIALAVVGVAAAVVWIEALPPGARIAWVEDYREAQRLAREQGRPMLIDFGADWCNACKEIEHEAFADPRVVAEAKRFVPVRIDLSAGKATPDKWALLRNYKQPGLPLVVLHHGDGEEAHRVTTPVPADSFLERMRAVR